MAYTLSDGRAVYNHFGPSTSTQPDTTQASAPETRMQAATAGMVKDAALFGGLSESESAAIQASLKATKMGADSATAAAVFNAISPKKKKKS